MNVIRTTNNKIGVVFEDQEEIDRLFFDIMEARTDLYYKRAGNIKRLACVNAFVALLATAGLNERKTNERI